MKYLTRIVADKAFAVSRRLIDSYAWHKALWEAFPNREKKPRNFLSRIDEKEGHYQVLLLSEDKPTLPEWGKWETREIPSKFFEYNLYRFQLRANPTVKRVIRNDSGERKKNGRRTALYNWDELKAWLQRKALEAGFKVERIDIDPPLAEPFRRKGKEGKHVRADFRGMLRVLDQAAFKAAFSKGIGPAKAFGFGMLILEPLR